MNTPFLNQSAFINRQQELHFLQMWLKEEPKNLLFVYGPKSGGKTTLLNHLAEQTLSPKTYEIKYLNLRQVAIHAYQDFLRTLFGVDHSLGSPKKERIAARTKKKENTTSRFSNFR